MVSGFRLKGDLELVNVGECLVYATLGLKGEKKNTLSYCTNLFSSNRLGIVVTADF